MQTELVVSRNGTNWHELWPTTNLLMKAIAERGRYESSAAFFPLGLVMNIRSHLDIHVEVVGAG